MKNDSPPPPPLACAVYVLNEPIFLKKPTYTQTKKIQQQQNKHAHEDKKNNHKQRKTNHFTRQNVTLLICLLLRWPINETSFPNPWTYWFLNQANGLEREKSIVNFYQLLYESISFFNTV